MRSVKVAHCHRPASQHPAGPSDMFGESVSIDERGIAYTYEDACVLAEALALKAVGDNPARVQRMRCHARSEGDMFVCLAEHQQPFASRGAVLEHAGAISYFWAVPIVNGELDRIQKKIAE